MACDANLCPTLKPGLTVREYFAGQALAAMKLPDSTCVHISASNLDSVGRDCVRYAEAVLEALKKR